MGEAVDEIRTDSVEIIGFDSIGLAVLSPQTEQNLARRFRRLGGTSLPAISPPDINIAPRNFFNDEAHERGDN